jgi:hypothetical protein
VRAWRANEHGNGSSLRQEGEVRTLRPLSIVALVAVVLALAAMLVEQVTSDASANSCQQACRAAHNQCRIATKGSPSCDAQLQSCMRACIPAR